MGTIRDFIPEGEDTGAQGSGFKDFVPSPEEKQLEVKEEIVKEEVKRGVTKK